MPRLALFLALALSPAAALAHDPYTGLRSPTGVSCCSGGASGDCRPVSMCRAAGGGEGLLLDGVCVPVPYEKVIDAPGIQGTHACFRPTAEGGRIVFCVMLGAAS